MHRRRIAARTNTFHEKRNPSSGLNCSFAIVRGIPPSMVPAGQMYLQKPGTAFTSGIMITNPINMTYFRYERILVILLFLIFGTGILAISSCKNPKGHKKPQMNLPRSRPKRIIVPST